jgi:hypothetical protein
VILLRLETIDGRGLIQSRSLIKNSYIKDIIDALCLSHQGPFADMPDDSEQIFGASPIRGFKSAIKGRSECCKFAFTLYALENVRLARDIVEIVSLSSEIRLRILIDPEIVWVGYSGLQAVFIDKEIRHEEYINKRHTQESDISGF